MPNLNGSNTTLHVDDEVEDSISISTLVYQKLCQASVDLIRANKTVDKLNEAIRKKDFMIEKLKAEMLKRTPTDVSLFS